MIQTPIAVFVTANNTVYATAYGLRSVLVWPEGSASPTRSIFTDLNETQSIFLTTNGDVYADNGYFNGRIEKWTINASNSITVMNIIGRCGGIFVDVYDNFYCSLTDFHRVISRRIDSVDNSTLIVAGTGTLGSASDALAYPLGIFVDIDISLYVAEYGNNRIQGFRSGQLNGITVAGNGTSGSITLYQPTRVILDADGYLFIADHGYHRIVASGPNGFRCIAGCTGTSGSGANQLVNPFSLSFDSYGNLYVSDPYNNRVQKFLLATNSCSKSFL